ncbi:hypothetical protein QUF90_17035 [Desulfococcaceae bacterium HSG9]|nr:hypothetical protein [Desulfococcaceae bacterium HSG9]
MCDHYCSADGPFRSVIILFDEFGRYLKFAAERPYIAGDAALQQLFEGVQNNSDQCFLLCFIQYELKAYISRVSYEKQDTLKRYIGRYDSAPKFYLSTNLETLFANLIHKQDREFLAKYLLADKTQWKTLHESIQKWFPKEANRNVWLDSELFQKVILEGCWPLHPLSVWFLCHLSSTGKELQQRSAISFIEEVLSQEIETELNDKQGAWCIPATRLCTPSLFEELLASEEYGLRGAGAHAFLAAEQRYKNDLSDTEREILLAVLIAAKTKLKVGRDEFHHALSAFSGIPLHLIQPTVHDLMAEYGVLEWNDRFQRYEIIGDAVPRTEFTKFLNKKSAMLSTERIEDLFAAHIKNWAELQELAPSFAYDNEIISNEWHFQIECTNIRRIAIAIKNAVQDWKNAVQVDTARGQLLYCYVSPDADSVQMQKNISKILNGILSDEKCEKGAPILIVMLHDVKGKLKQVLAEYQIICNDLTEDEKQRYTNFIRDYNTQLTEELKLTHEEMVQKRNYIFPKKIKVENMRLKK